MAHKELRGERVSLRPLERTDLPRCVAWFNDREVTYYLGRDGPLTMEEEDRWFANYKAKTDELIFAITVDGHHIGNVGLHNIDRNHRRAEVGIVIGEKSHWSKGYGSEALRAVLEYAFPGSEALAAIVARGISKFPERWAFLMRRHGVLAVGKDARAAYLWADLLESTAKTGLLHALLARQGAAGAPRDLPDPTRLARPR